MNIIRMSWHDYGIDKNTYHKIIEYIKQLSTEELGELMEICNDVDSLVSTWLFESITKNKSYDNLTGWHLIPVGRTDFYGKRRQVINELYKRKLKGTETINVNDTIK